MTASGIGTVPRPNAASSPLSQQPRHGQGPETPVPERRSQACPPRPRGGDSAWRIRHERAGRDDAEEYRLHRGPQEADDRRVPGQSALVTQRKETDTVRILSGVFEGRTLGTPIAMLVRNEDARSDHYDELREIYRPSHADYTYDARYGLRFVAGGGRASARETIGRVAAGALAEDLLAVAAPIEIVAWVDAIDDVQCPGVDEATITDQAALVRDLGAESIDFLDISFKCQQTFGVDLPARLIQDRLIEWRDLGVLARVVERRYGVVVTPEELRTSSFLKILEARRAMRAG